MAVLEKEDFWGGKLSKSSPQVKFNPEFEDTELSEVDHKLILSQACLGEKATGHNVVEVTALDFKGEECTHTIVSLREGSFEMCTLNLTFNPPATFKLIEGSGPVHLTGSHVQSLTEDDEESDEESNEDEEMPNLVDNKKKRPLPASTPKGPPKKMAKVEEESDDEESDDEEESDEEEEKPAAKKDKKQETKKPSKKVEKEAEEEEDDSEEESDDEEEDDDDDEEDSEDEDDDDDDDDDDESDEEEESDEEDEVTATLTGKKKEAESKKPLTNGVVTKKAGKGEKNTPQPKTPQQKAQKTPQTKTPSKDIDTIKQALLKSPALPKKIEKFQNFMRSSYKITDKDTVKEVWDYVQKNKK